MTVLLQRPYAGFQSGQTVNLPSSTEAALIAQGIATTAAVASSTTGALTGNIQQGRVAFAAAATSVVVTNALVDANTKIWAVINQSTADTTMTSITRIVPAAGSFTLFANAAATATVIVDWAIIPTIGVSGT